MRSGELERKKERESHWREESECLRVCVCVCERESVCVCVPLLAVHPISDSLSLPLPHTHFHSNLGCNSSSRSPGLSLPLSLSLLAQLLLCCFAAAGVLVCVRVSQQQQLKCTSDCRYQTSSPSHVNLLFLFLSSFPAIFSFSPLTHTLSLPSHLRVTHLLCRTLTVAARVCHHPQQVFPIQLLLQGSSQPDLLIPRRHHCHHHRHQQPKQSCPRSTVPWKSSWLASTLTQRTCPRTRSSCTTTWWLGMRSLVDQRRPS